MCIKHREHLGSLTTDAAGKLHVLRHDGHTAGMDCAQVGVLEQTNQVRLRGLLECHHGGRLEAEIRFEVLGDLADETLERSLFDQKVRGLLVSADLTHSNSARAITLGLLSTVGSSLASLGSELLTRSLATSGLASGLLGASHVK